MRRRVAAALILLTATATATVAACSSGSSSSTATSTTTAVRSTTTSAAARTTIGTTTIAPRPSTTARPTTSAARTTTTAKTSTTTAKATTTVATEPTTVPDTSGPTSTQPPAAPCDAATLLQAAVVAFGPLPDGATVSDPRCAENYASALLTAPGQDSAFAVFDNTEGEWEGLNLGTDQVCSSSNIPLKFFDQLGCGPWEG